MQGSGYFGLWGAVKRLSRKQEMLAVKNRGAVLASLICFSIRGDSGRSRLSRNVTL